MIVLGAAVQAEETSTERVKSPLHAIVPVYVVSVPLFWNVTVTPDVAGSTTSVEAMPLSVPYQVSPAVYVHVQSPFRSVQSVPVNPASVAVNCLAIPVPVQYDVTTLFVPQVSAVSVHSFVLAE